MKIDSHQHFWIYDPPEYSWINDSMKILQRNFLPEDLYPVLEKNGVSGSVAVQARQTSEETRWLLHLAEQFSFIKGIVGWADLRSDKLEQQLDEFCRYDQFRGIRHVVQDEPEDGFMLRDDFLRGISILQEYNLTYDLLVYPKHLPVAESVVSAFPGQKFVLDHIAKPLIKHHILDPWKEDLCRLAEHPNVWCKLSGMVTEADWHNHTTEDFVPFLEAVFEAFGPERLMMGSDWPVCLLAGDYLKVTGIVEDYISDLTDDDREKIMGLNCMNFYGLKKIDRYI